MAQPTLPQRCYVIGYLGSNHNGDPQLARHLVDMVVQAGCNAVAIPVRNRSDPGDTGSLGGTFAPPGQGNAWAGPHATPGLSPEGLAEVRDACRGRVDFIASPYDLESLEELGPLEPDAFQVEPPVLLHGPLLGALARPHRPLFLVAGMCSEADLAYALERVGSDQVTLLHCVYSNDLSLDGTALGYIPYLRERFGVPVGYMGLEPGVHAAIAAVALGAVAVEKPFTSDHYLPGTGHRRSLDREELRQLVSAVRDLEKALGPVQPRGLLPAELSGGDPLRAHLVAARDLVAGTVLEESMLSVRLASRGVGPRLMDRVVGRRLLYNVSADTPITFGVIEP